MGMQRLPTICAWIGAVIAVYYCVASQDPKADVFVRIIGAIVLVPLTAAVGFFIGRLLRRILIGNER
jgi:hypothetical protein